MGLIIFWLPEWIENSLGIFLIASGVMISFILILKIAYRGKPYLFQIVIMRSGANHHFKIRGDSLQFEHTYNIGEKEKTLNIESKRLYRLKPTIKQSIIFWFMSIKNKFLIVFREGKNKPVQYPEYQVSSRILWEVNESRALDKGLKEEWKVPLDPKNLIIYFGIIVASVILYLVLTGQVNIK